MGGSFGGEGDAFRSFLRLPRPPMPRRQNTLGRSRKPAASPIDARAKGQARFPGRVPNPGLRTGCECIHMRVRRAVVRPAHQLLVSTARPVRACARVATPGPYPSPGTLRNGLLRPGDGGTAYLLPPGPGCASGRG